MRVPMVQVGVVRMRMNQSRVAVRVRVRFAAVPIEVVRMLMMRVVHVLVLVPHFLVRMLVLMTFGEVQPYAERHQRRRGPDCQISPLNHYGCDVRAARCSGGGRAEPLFIERPART